MCRRFVYAFRSYIYIGFRRVLPTLPGCLSKIMVGSCLVFLLEINRVVSFLGEVLLVVDAVVSILPADDLVAPVSDLVAECLHGKNRERLFHLRRKLLNTKHEQAQDCRRGDHHDVVPRFLEGIEEGEGKEGEPNEEESSDVTVVEDRNGTGEETLTGTEVVLEDRQGLVHLILSDEVHGELFHRERQIKEGAVGSVGGIDDRLGLAGFQPLEELGLEVILILPLGGQVSLHGTDKGPGALGETIQIRLSLLRCGLGIIVEGGSHADKVAGVVAEAIAKFKNQRRGERNRCEQKEGSEG